MKRGASCPSCGRHLTGATAMSHEPIESTIPEPGDATICSYCGAILIFTRGMRLRHASARERSEIEALPVTAPFLMVQARAMGKKPS